MVELNHIFILFQIAGNISFLFIPFSAILAHNISQQHFVSVIQKKRGRGTCKELSTKMSRQVISRYNQMNHNNHNGNGGALKLPSFTFARHSVACERHPDRNEDSIVADERRGLAA